MLQPLSNFKLYFELFQYGRKNCNMLHVRAYCEYFYLNSSLHCNSIFQQMGCYFT